MTTNFLGFAEHVIPSSHHKGIMDRLRLQRRLHPDQVFTSNEMAIQAKVGKRQAVCAIRSLVDSGELVADKSQRQHRYRWRQA